eukprot:51902-Chlamydomonas_euryale.AAC.1
MVESTWLASAATLNLPILPSMRTCTHMCPDNLRPENLRSLTDPSNRAKRIDIDDIMHHFVLDCKIHNKISFLYVLTDEVVANLPTNLSYDQVCSVSHRFGQSSSHAATPAWVCVVERIKPQPAATSFYDAAKSEPAFRQRVCCYKSAQAKGRVAAKLSPTPARPCHAW